MNHVPVSIRRPIISSADEVIAEAASGRMVILLDDEDHENKGDLIIPAQFATADAVNFMARYGRGLICLALTSSRVQKLGLYLAVRSPKTKAEMALTQPIEARDGVTTGISAADRARTIAVAVGAETKASDIVSQGHILPLCAQDGGTLARPGHTEAAVDLARLAGLIPAGVICEMTNEDGTMARLQDLAAVSRQHGIKLGTIADLVEYRHRTEKLVEQIAISKINHPMFGEWNLSVYRDKVEGGEHLALVKGDLVHDRSPALVNLHFVDAISDLFLTHADEFGSGMRQILHEGRGVVLLIGGEKQETLGARVMAGYPLTHRAPRHRDYCLCVQILRDISVEDVILTSKNESVAASLEGYGLKVGY
ncbi:MAG: 3,4-dihydroxy-2-butanone-4-phosphate synthase [Beijerinckiaceae bacterium]|nr:MAG: 3,4-dihydroxy-2-butanone-4-phosphate synthase [Beijerinckiaceae bacterium]